MDDNLWVKIKPILPVEKPKTGRPRANLRRAFNGILYMLTTGCAWSDVPKVYGAKSTIHRLHLELCRNKAYEQIFQIFLSQRYELKSLICLFVLLIQIPFQLKRGDIGYDGHKKVKGSKISILVDRDGLPLSVALFPANVHDSKTYKPTMEDFKIKREAGRPGRPITRPEAINCDCAYDLEEIRSYNRRRGIRSNIPVNERNRKNKKKGRPKRFKQLDYKFRRFVERAFAWITSFKRLALRYEVDEKSFIGLLYLGITEK